LRAAEEAAAKLVEVAVVVPPLVPVPPVASEFTLPSTGKKQPRRTLGLAVGLSNLAAGGSVMVESVKNSFA
jgi:hypothetical protein